ncbi:FtsX-like permease family protein [Entomoplasma freundtii]|nr:ABC transporter permease [Entomoplasma freundtii]
MKEFFEKNKEKFKDYKTFMGLFIRDNVFSFSYLFTHQILLPSLNNEEVLVDFHDLITEKWEKESYKNYGQVYRLINQDFQKNSSLATIKIDSNFTISYSWANYGNKRIKFNLEPINLNQSDNVVLLSGKQSALKNMQDNEVIISDKYAKNNRLKIGDFITLNNYIHGDGKPLSFSTYKIIGYGTKIDNLFDNKVLDNANSNDEVYCYLTNNEIEKYIEYWYEVDNLVILPNHKRDYQNQVFLKTRLIGSNKEVKKFSENLIKNKILMESPKFTRYKEEGFSQTLNIYIIEASLFILIGCILLILSTIFINYCLKKELALISSTIGILKASGYSGFEMAKILWIRVFLILFIGFLIGFFISLPLQSFVNGIIATNSFVIINKVLWHWSFILISIFILPLVLSMISFVSLYFYLNSSAIELTNNVAQSNNEAKHIRKVQFNKEWNPFRKILFLKFNGRTATIISVLALAFLAFCFEINGVTLMTNLTNKWPQVLNNIDSSFNNGYKFNWKKDVNGRFYFDDCQNYNIDYDFYNKDDYIDSNIDSTAVNTINNYLKSNNDSVNEKIMKIFQIDFNRLTIPLISLEDFMLKFTEDYQKGLITLPVKEMVDEIEKNWIPQFKTLKDKIIKKNITISFNKMFVRENQDFPLYKIALENKPYNFVSSKNWQLFLINDYSKKAFKWKEIDFEKVKNTNSRDYFPVIVTDHFAKLNKLKIGDVFEVELAKSHDDSSLKLIIKSINKSDIYTNNIYGSDEVFFKNFTSGSSNVKVLKNEILTKNRTLISKANINDFQINVPYFSFFIPQSKNEKITLISLVKNPNQIYDFMTWNSFGSTNYINYYLETKIVNDKNNDFANLMIFISISTFIIVAIMYFVLSLVTFMDQSKYLKILKAIGYNNTILNLNLNLKIFFGIIFATILGTIINFIVWKIVINILFKNAQILVPSPFNWGIVWLGFLIILLIFILGCLLNQFLLKKIKINY